MRLEAQTRGHNCTLKTVLTTTVPRITKTDSGVVGTADEQELRRAGSTGMALT